MTSPTEPATCSACGASAVRGGVCGRCGYAAGEAHRCPHCNAIARAERKMDGTSVTWVCAICGGPRVPAGTTGTTTSSEAVDEALRSERTFNLATNRARGKVFAWGLLAVLATLMGVVAWPAAIAGKLMILALVVSATTLAVRARVRSARATESAKAAHERAWLAAAEDVASAQSGGISAGELATRLQIDTAKAEALLTSLAVNDRTRVDVGDDAEVRYSVPGDALRMRVDQGHTEIVDAEPELDAHARQARRGGT